MPEKAVQKPERTATISSILAKLCASGRNSTWVSCEYNTLPATGQGIIFPIPKKFAAYLCSNRLFHLFVFLTREELPFILLVSYTKEFRFIAWSH